MNRATPSEVDADRLSHQALIDLATLRMWLADRSWRFSAPLRPSCVNSGPDRDAAGHRY